MRNLLARVERLEAAAGGADADPLLIIIRFVEPGRDGEEPRAVYARSVWAGGLHPSEELKREPSETEQGFRERIDHYFRRFERGHIRQ